MPKRVDNHIFNEPVISKDTGQELNKKLPQIVEFANLSYPIVGEMVFKQLIPDFLAWKLKEGSEHEKKIYTDMSPAAFLDRLLRNRPIVFFTATDQYLLRVPQDHDTGKPLSDPEQSCGSDGFDDLEKKGYCS